MATTDDAEATDSVEDDADAHREWGRRANQRVWTLLAAGTPTADDAIRELVDAAHASQWHWSFAGGALERQRGEWLLSLRVGSRRLRTDAVRATSRARGRRRRSRDR